LCEGLHTGLPIFQWRARRCHQLRGSLPFIRIPLTMPRIVRSGSRYRISIKSRKSISNSLYRIFRAWGALKRRQLCSCTRLCLPTRNMQNGSRRGFRLAHGQSCSNPQHREKKLWRKSVDKGGKLHDADACVEGIFELGVKLMRCRRNKSRLWWRCLPPSCILKDIG